MVLFIHMKEPFLLMLDGMTGAGKTTTARLLTEQLPRTALIRMDVIKKFISDFERGVRDNTIAKEVMFVMVRKYLELGLSVIIDQPFKDEEISRYAELAEHYSVQCYKFQLFADSETAYRRVLNRQQDRADAEKVPEDRIRDNIARFQNRENMGFTVIDTSSLAADEASKIILSQMG